MRKRAKLLPGKPNQNESSSSKASNGNGKRSGKSVDASSNKRSRTNQDTDEGAANNKASRGKVTRSSKQTHKENAENGSLMQKVVGRKPVSDYIINIIRFAIDCTNNIPLLICCGLGHKSKFLPNFQLCLFLLHSPLLFNYYCSMQQLPHSHRYVYILICVVSAVHLLTHFSVSLKRSPMALDEQVVRREVRLNLQEKRAVMMRMMMMKKTRL